jgi:protein-tyrosine phosphatase
MDLYWIDSSLAIASRPRGGDWLDDEMASLRREGVDLLVSCLVPSEEQELRLSDEEPSAIRAGIAFARVPIEDRSIPANTADFEEVIRRLATDRRAGRRVAVHCRQGLGRAPLVAAAVLVRSGWSADEAWSLIQECRNRPVPDTDEQREWIHAFACDGGREGRSAPAGEALTHRS